MSRFNEVVKTAQPNTTNLAGGKAYKQGADLELVSLLLTSFGNDQYYRKAPETFKRVGELLAENEPKFAAQAIVYARTVFGMRTITHVASALMGRLLAGVKWAPSFFNKVIHRPDDMLEIAAYYTEFCADKSIASKKHAKKALTNAMKAGFATAFERFDQYQLAKYRGEGKRIKLVDVVNSCHPKATPENKAAIEALVKGDLKSVETWEAKLSEAGQLAESEEDKVERKKDAWEKLIQEKKMGYLALLRNLRNIMNQAPDVLPQALESLMDAEWIKKNLIFPFQYLTAYKQFTAMNTKEARSIAAALAKCVDISADNLKSLNLTGNTLVAIDNSGSMDSKVTNSEHMKKSELGALFGIVFAKAINADIMEFGTTARYVQYGLNENSMNFAADFHAKNAVGHGTNFHAVLMQADKKYDRILFFSDMQGWIGGGAPDAAFLAYKKKFGANSFIYSFDLAGYGTMQFPQDKVFALAGYSDRIFDLMKSLEIDKHALLADVKKIEL